MYTRDIHFQILSRSQVVRQLNKTIMFEGLTLISQTHLLRNIFNTLVNQKNLLLPDLISVFQVHS